MRSSVEKFIDDREVYSEYHWAGTTMASNAMAQLIESSPASVDDSEPIVSIEVIAKRVFAAMRRIALIKRDLGRNDGSVAVAPLPRIHVDCGSSFAENLRALGFPKK